MDNKELWDEADTAHLVTILVVDGIDVFTRKTYCECIIDCLDFCIRKKGMILYSYVIMSDHIHMIVKSEKATVSELVHDFKKLSSKRIIDKIETEHEHRKEWMLERFRLAKSSHGSKKYRFWQAGTESESIQSESNLKSKIDYIHLNPVRAQIVADARNYIYSSAENYCGGSGRLKLVNALSYKNVFSEQF